MNQNQTAGQECLSLFITYDPFGVPERVDCHRVAVEGHTAQDAAFMNYLTEERNAVLRGETFPDLRVCRYDFDKALLRAGHEENLITNPIVLKAFIDENHLKPVYNFSLRRYDALIFAAADQMEERNNESIHREIESLEGLKYYMDPASVLSDEVKEVVKHCLEYLRDCDPSEGKKLVSAIETGQGTLLFPFKSPLTHDFLQYVADHFFSAEAPQIGYVREYTIINPTHEQWKQAEQSGFMFSLGKREFLPEQALWCQPSQLSKERQTGCQYNICPSYRAFHDFTQDHKLEISASNRQMSELLLINERGMPAGRQTTNQCQGTTNSEKNKLPDNRSECVITKVPESGGQLNEIQNKQRDPTRVSSKNKNKIESAAEQWERSQRQKTARKIKSKRRPHR